MVFLSRGLSGRLFQLPNIKRSYNNQLNFSRNVSSTRPNLGILHHEWIAAGKVASEKHPSSDDDRVVVFLHGLLGNGKNLRTPAKKLTELHPSLSVLLLDLRGHGMTHVEKSKTEPFTQPHSIDACANDIHETLTSLKLVGPTKSPIGIIGHSFGGRCALSYTHKVQTNFHDSSDDKHWTTMVHPPKNTWLLDTVPGIADASVANVVQVLNQVKIPINNKRMFGQDLIQEHKIDPAIAAWMATNLTKIDDGFDFTFDLNVVHSVLDDFPKQPFIQMIEDCISEKNSSNIHVVIAGKNKEWTDEILNELQSVKENDKLGSLKMHTLAKAGHWVHVDDLNGLMNIINQGLSK